MATSKIKVEKDFGIMHNARIVVQVIEALYIIAFFALHWNLVREEGF
jgi:hypothetical protein